MRSLVCAAAAAMLFATSASSAAARGWALPVDGAVLRPFLVGPDRFAAGQHRGVDLGAAPGTLVRAACGGRVSFAGRVPRGGRTVSVRCGPLVATYQHLGAVAVRRGRLVAPGGRIGTVGRARPRPHVHLGAREAATGAYVDPLALIAGTPRAPAPPLPVSRRPPPLGPARAPAPAARRPLPAGPLPAPVPAPATRRLPPLGRAPAPAPARAGRRAPPLRRAPAPAPAGRRAPARPFDPAAARLAGAPAPAAPDRLPWTVWLGLALAALGLPLGGGLVTVRRRRRRHSRAGVARIAS